MIIRELHKCCSSDHGSLSVAIIHDAVITGKHVPVSSYITYVFLGGFDTSGAFGPPRPLLCVREFTLCGSSLDCLPAVKLESWSS